MSDKPQTTAMSVSLPQTIVEDIVKAEIVRNLGQRDELIGAILGNVMQQECKCDRHRYGNPKRTIMACELERQIEAACKEVVGAWITANKDKFKLELEKRLSKREALQALVSAFAAGINTGQWAVNVQLKEKKD